MGAYELDPEEIEALRRVANLQPSDEFTVRVEALGLHACDTARRIIERYAEVEDFLEFGGGRSPVTISNAAARADLRQEARVLLGFSSSVGSGIVSVPIVGQSSVA